MKMKKTPKKTKSILEKINKGNAHENESSPALENNDNNKNRNQGETGKAIQMNEHSNKHINTEKKIVSTKKIEKKQVVEHLQII